MAAGDGGKGAVVGGSRGDWPLRVLLVAAVLVPVLVIALVAVTTYRNTMDDARGEVERTADLMREHASRVFDTTALVARSIEPLITGFTEEEVRAAEAAINARLEDLTADYDHLFSTTIIAANGDALVSARVYPIPPGTNLAERDYFIAVRDNPGLREYVSRVLRIQTPEGEDALFFQVARPRLTPEGDFDGLIAVSIEPTYFSDVYAQFAGDSDLIAALVRQDGSVLAFHPFSAEIALDEVDPVEEFAALISDSPTAGVVSSFAGNDILVAFRRVDDRPLYVAVALPLSAVRGDWLRFMGWVLAAAVPATAALIVITLMAMRQGRRRAEAITALEIESTRRAVAEEQLRQSFKMEAIGQLSGGIAHDFNNLMTAIGGNLELLARKLPPGEATLSRYVESSRDAVQRAARLTQRLLAFSRRQPLQPSALSLNTLVSGMSDLLHRSLGDAVSVETVLGAGLWRTFVDPNQLENALLNLAINARDAMPDGGKVTIETANAHLDADYLAREGLHDLKPGQYVLLAVSDTGEGMSRETAARAFDPFFTTKGPGQGTGLGLSMVHGFVKQSGGHIRIYSEVGQGTTIKIYLPRLTDAAAGMASAEAPAQDAPAEPEEPGGTILVIEDDDGVLEFERETLASEGYDVLVARDGREAMKIVESDTPIDLIVTDVVLPNGMNGRQIADAAKKVRPATPVLFTTGYTTNAIVHQGRLDEDVVLLSKPFSSQALTSAVVRLLRSSRQASQR
ncbi:MAG: response regulator [Bauldia sp.]|nr:response regulator [Bauldia sp.]